MVERADLAPFVPRLVLQRPADAPRRWTADGTMVLVDISGFTSLSEQLAARGRVGAEDLVSTLTRLYTLLMSASEDGGDVVKFAGDALLIMYDGPDHERHACHAASVLQRLLAVVGTVRLSGARARLRMSVGVHSGRFEMLLTGAEHQNLVVAGPDLGRVLELQDAAVAGEILVSEEVAATLPASARRRERAGAVVLGRVPTMPSVGRPPGAATDATRFLPAAFAARPDLLTADSDHRRAAMGFVQVGDVDGRLRDDPVGLAALVDELTAVVEASCAEHDVTLLDIDVARDGFRYFLAAGAPLTVEDPEGRLLRTLHAIASAETPLAVRAGAAAGQVFAGAVGASFRRTFTAMGDTTNLAARLTAKAPPGSVLAHAPMLARSRTVFDVAAHDPLTVKGKVAPIEVGVVTGISGRRTRTQGEQALVGRDAELDALARHLAAAVGGHGAVAQVVGEAGIGKSRLALEAAARTGLPVVTLGADPYGADVPHRALTLLLRPLLGLTDLDPAEVVVARLTDVVRERVPAVERWLPLLAPAVGATVPGTREVDDLDERFRAARFHDAVGALLDALLPEPTVLLVDDAQWVDQASVDALAAVLGDLAGRPWAVVLTRRDDATGLVLPEDGDALAVLTVRPGRIAPAAARSLVRAVVGDALRRPVVEAIVERAGGNPYFLLELATSDVGQRRGEDLPVDVEELVGLRIDGLDAAERDLLRQAAVLGARFPAALFGETTGRPGLAEAAREPGLGQFLTVDDQDVVAFRREIHREVAYEQLTFRRRRDVHRRAAAALERRPELAGGALLPLLSLHTYQAGAWAEAYRASRAAADEAQRTFAGDEAAVFCRRALEAGRRTQVPREELREVQLTLGEVLALAGAHDEAVRAYSLARRGVTDPERAARIVTRIGMVRREEGRSGPALTAVRQVRRLADGAASPVREELVAEADLLAAGVRYWQGRGADTTRLARTAAAHAERLPEGPTRTRLLARAYALHDTAVVELEGRAGDYGDRPVRMFEEIGDLYHQGRFSTNLAYGLFYEGDWDGAVRYYRVSLELAERIGDVFSVAVAQMNLGELLAQQGRPREAVEQLRESIEGLGGLRTPLAAAHAECFLGDALRLCGEHEAAAAALDRAADLFAAAGRSSGFSLDELATRRLELAVAARGAGAAADAEALLARPEPLAPLHRARALRSLALARLAAGDRAGARAALEECLPVARDQPLGYEAALTLLVVAGLGDDDASSARAEATAILHRLGVTDVAAVTPR